MATETTTQRLLEAATGIFARDGYENARIADICDSAEANVASVNYHFGSKEGLLREVIRYAFDLAEATYPMRGSLDPNASPSDRLRAFMSAMIRRGLESGPAGQFDRIMSHEGTRIGGPDDMIIAEVTRLQGDMLDRILSELLGEVSSTDLIQARFDVIALCVFPNVAPRVRILLFPDSPSPEAIDRYLDRQITFALAGLDAIAHPAGSKV